MTGFHLSFIVCVLIARENGHLNNMKVTVYGSGYVGLVAAACFAEVGNQVLCMDVNAQRIENLQKGIIPIYEPGLEELVIKTQTAKILQFTSDIKEAVAHGECQFIAVGTPPDKDGKADLKYVLACAQSIADHLQDYTIVINKSTVPIGTADKVTAVIQNGLKQRGKDIAFDVVSNPEFLREGAALKDFRQPDRVVIGTNSQRAADKLMILYGPFNHENNRIIKMDRRSAELTKYAANAMLATKISFMNEMANLAEQVGADIEQVRLGIGADQRIGYHFTHAGCGYGGSCFGKDIQALIHTAQDYQSKAEIIQAVENVNQRQKTHLFTKIKAHFKEDLKNKVFAIWGLSFKPETDDMRDAPSIPMIKLLLAQGAKVQAFDPQAMHEAKKYLSDDGIHYCSSPYEALEGADALVLLTEWRVFNSPDFNAMKSLLRQNVVFDGRNVYAPDAMAQMGFVYYGIGRGAGGF